MKKADKFRSDLDELAKKTAKDQGKDGLEGFRRLLYRNLNGLPHELLAGTFLSFQDKYLERGSERALEWLAGVVSLYLGEYDGTKFSREEWMEIRETVDAEAGEIDLDLLTQIMVLVMENGALD
jgi:hypothetical protein